MWEVIARLGFPLGLAFATMPFLSLFGVAVSVGVFFTVYIIWLIIINGGFLIMDGDLNIFD